MAALADRLPLLEHRPHGVGGTAQEPRDCASLFGRAAFWPRRPTADARPSRLWARVAGAVAARPRLVWTTTAAGLVVAAAAFMPQLRADGTAQTDVFTDVDSVEAQDVLAEHFPRGSGAPAIVVADAAGLDAVAATFSALAVLPLLILAQIAFVVAFGVMLDTILVRSLLVPALTLGIGRTTWWPSRLARRPQH